MAHVGRRARIWQSVGLVCCAVGYVAVRVVLALRHPPLTFNDSSSYAWNGSKTVRPYGISALFDVLGTNSLRVVLQTVVGSSCWIWLFYELRFTLSAAGKRRVANACFAGLVLATLSAPIARWDGAVLSETLALGLLAALCAAWLRIRQRLTLLTTGIAVGVIAAAALVRETVFLALALPLAIAVAFEWTQRLRTRKPPNPARSIFLPLLIGTVIVIPLTIVTLKPGNVAFFESATLTNFRTMNVIGQRILPDPYLRSQMQQSGLPADVAANSELRKPRFSMDDDWRLFRTPELVRFANDFPTSSYLLAEMKRPRTFTRFVSAAFDRRVFDRTTQYGKNSLVPNSVAAILWGWPAALHFGLFIVTLTMLLLGHRRLTRAERTVALGSVTLTVGMAGAAVLAHMLDAMEQARHVLPFWVFGRLALVVSVLVLGGATLGVPIAQARKRISLQMNGRGRFPVVLGFVAGVVAAIVSSFLFFGITNRSTPAPRIKAAKASATVVNKVETALRADGVVVSPRVHDMLGPLLGAWEARPDLQAAFSVREGMPDVGRLSGWMRQLPDSSAEGFIPHLGALEELRGRMGIVSPETGIAPTLFWSVKNARIDRDVSGVIWHVVDYCRANPEVQAKFTSGDQVDVVGLLRQVAAPGSRNPTESTDTPVLQEIVTKLIQ